MGWTVRDRIPVGTRISARPDRPWGPSSLLYNGYRVFPGGRSGRVVGLIPTPSSAEGSRKEYSHISTHPKDLRGIYRSPSRKHQNLLSIYSALLPTCKVATGVERYANIVLEFLVTTRPFFHVKISF